MRKPRKWWTRLAAGGFAVAVDHQDEKQVQELVERIDREQNGRLDILVNGIWGGDPLAHWDVPFWEQPIGDAIQLLRQGVETHLITSRFAVPLMVARKSGLIIELTDGTADSYRGSLYYDLVKSSVNRLALAQAADLRSYGITAVALSPGFLRSEAMLDHFGVSEENWRDGTQKDPHFIISETPNLSGPCGGCARQRSGSATLERKSRRNAGTFQRLRLHRHRWHSPGHRAVFRRGRLRKQTPERKLPVLGVRSLAALARGVESFDVIREVAGDDSALQLQRRRDVAAFLGEVNGKYAETTDLLGG